jgi:signal transduction histidine kinase
MKRSRLAHLYQWTLPARRPMLQNCEIALWKLLVSTPLLIEEAWALLFRERTKVRAIAEQIVSVSQPGSTNHSWGTLLYAHGLRAQGRRDAAAIALAMAKGMFSAQSNRAGLAACFDLRALELIDAGDEVGAFAAIQEARCVPDSERGVWDRLNHFHAQQLFATRFQGWEAGFRVLLRMIAAARETNDDAAIGQTHSILAALYAGASDFERALEHANEAVARTLRFEPGSAWYVPMLNLLTVHLGREDVEASRIVAARMQARDTQFYPSIREQSNVLYARAATLSGNFSAAVEALEVSRTVVSTRLHVHAWTAAFAGLHFAQGNMQLTRDTCEGWITDTPTHVIAPPLAVSLRIFRYAARACEAGGDHKAALKYEREAAKIHDHELDRAARARRAELEISFDLDRERWARDVAEKQHLKAEAERARLDELNHKLDAALQTRTRFLAAASHDLRQPAHALALYAQALEHETSPSALVELSRRMRATVGSLSNMFDGLLELARLDAGAVKPQHDVFDLNELLARLCAEYADRLTHANAVLRFRRLKGDCFLRSDPVLVERILRNLIGNAVKYAGSGNILVAIRKRGHGLVVEVRDSGPGMSTDELRHIFDEFFRASSASERRDGLGLGLSIVERFVRLLGMQIYVRSAVGRGSTFGLDVPFDAVALAPERKPEIAARPVTGRALTVAVIDDDPDARGAMSLLLSKWGHVCVSGAHAEAVIAQCQQSGIAPDVVVTDFQLREGNAIAGIDALRHRWGSDLPVLVVSGSSDAQAIVEATFWDVSCLPKPVRPLRLKSWLSAQGALAA